MRKLKLQMQLSGDGFVAGPNGEMDWMSFNWDDKLKDYVTKVTDSTDTILMGRKLAEGFIPYWKDAASKKDDPQYDFAKKMHEYPKIVFSKSLTKNNWENTTIEKDDSIINQLKNKDGKDIIVYGGAEFVSSLIDKDLIDELHLYINPTALGEGLSIFKHIKKLKLVESIAFDCGIVLLKYEPLKD